MHRAYKLISGVILLAGAIAGTDYFFQEVGRPYIRKQAVKDALANRRFIIFSAPKTYPLDDLLQRAIAETNKRMKEQPVQYLDDIPYFETC